MNQSTVWLGKAAGFASAAIIIAVTYYSGHVISMPGLSAMFFLAAVMAWGVSLYYGAKGK